MTDETQTFHVNDVKANREIARFSSDGVWVNPDLPVDEAARQFLDVVSAAWGGHFTRTAVEAERARIRAMVKRLHDIAYENWLAEMHYRIGGAEAKGRLDMVAEVLSIIDGEDTSHA